MATQVGKIHSQVSYQGKLHVEPASSDVPNVSLDIDTNNIYLCVEITQKYMSVLIGGGRGTEDAELFAHLSNLWLILI
jgi:hypothetical protein